jgi:8-oxo-dGTP pyrophosphatase MutT (NUDIX family)
MSKSKHMKTNIATKGAEQVNKHARLKDRIINWLFQLWFLLTRSMTLGVRIVALDDQGRIFLVRHTYGAGWHLPGGGIERAETAEQAAHKELSEEGNLIVEGALNLKGIYFNKKMTKRDHVLLYTCQVRQLKPKLPDREIVESGFFDMDDLPIGATNATQTRIAELQGACVVSQYWS